MSGDEPMNCDLCGLDATGKPFRLRSAGRILHFCCEGCEGIFRMLNEVDEQPDEPPGGAARPQS